MAEQYSNRLAAIRFHWWYPSDQDPFYVFNPLENGARFHYYNVYYVTYVKFDGIIHNSDFGSPVWDSTVVQRAAIPSPLAMHIYGNYDSGQREAHVEIEIYKDIDTALSGLYLHCFLTESNIFFNAPNGLQIHNQTMRDDITDTLGQALNFVDNDSLRLAYTFRLHDILTPFNCEIVAFVQNRESHEVLQACKIRLPELNPSEVENEPTLPENTAILTAYPNPFNSSVKLKWLVSSLQGDESVKIYDISGRLVQTLTIPARVGEVVWDGKDNDGHGVASGVYFARLIGRDLNLSVKLTLLK